MLVQEPVHAAIWHCLNHYSFGDATFLAERLFSEVNSEDSLHLLATCYYRSGRCHEAYDLLQTHGVKKQENRFLLAKCAFDLKRMAEAECALHGNSFDLRKELHTDEFVAEFGDSAAFALQLLARLYGQTERRQRACEADRKALKLNPFLWKSFEALCQRGEFPDPTQMFTVKHLESFSQCHGINGVIHAVNSLPNAPSPCPHFGLANVSQSGLVANLPVITLMSTPNSASTPQPPANLTPRPMETPELSTPMDLQSSDLHTPFSNGTPTSNASLNHSTRLMSGIGALNYTTDSEMPLATKQMNTSLLMPPPPQRKKNRNQPNTPLGLMIDKCLDDSFDTPTFGILPRHSMARLEVGSIALKLNFSSPSLSVLSPCPSANAPTQDPSNLLEKVPLGNKLKSSNSSSKENPPKPSVFGQSCSNSGNQNITPSPASQMVRRSSRLFGSTQSVKENSKAPAKKARAAKSPSRKVKTRLALSNQSELAEKNEKNKVEREKIGEDTKVIGGDDLIKPKAFVIPNLASQALAIQKQSMDGLMQLMRQLASAYIELAKYNSSKAIEILEGLPNNHFSTGWVMGLMARAHFDSAQYKDARRYFKSMREKDPYRLDFTEYYSTALWHLQEDVELSCLAQDLTKINKFSPQAWCAAGNCFSQLKEHENAIKFFQRAVQVDDTFAYAYTLLGHEYVMIEELEKALKCFRSAVRIDPRHYNAWYGIGLTYYKQERFQLADIYYKKALHSNPYNPILMCHVAVVQHSQQKTDKALETLNHAIQQAPKNSLCKFERASILFTAERYHEALEELNELKQLAPKESPVYFLLGKVHSKLNHTHLALMHFSWAMDLDPKGANAQIKDALDPNLNRANPDDTLANNAQENAGAAGEAANMSHANSSNPDGDDNLMQTESQDEFHDITGSFHPDGGASTSQESLDVSSFVGTGGNAAMREESADSMRFDVEVTPPTASTSSAMSLHPRHHHHEPSSHLDDSL